MFHMKHPRFAFTVCHRVQAAMLRDSDFSLHRGQAAMLRLQLFPLEHRPCSVAPRGRRRQFPHRAQAATLRLDEYRAASSLAGDDQSPSSSRASRDATPFRFRSSSRASRDATFLDEYLAASPLAGDEILITVFLGPSSWIQAYIHQGSFVVRIVPDDRVVKSILPTRRSDVRAKAIVANLPVSASGE